MNESGPIKSFALWIDSEGADATPWEMFLNGQLGLFARFNPLHSLGLMHLSGHLQRIRREKCGDDCLYLFLIGVDPNEQRKGLGRKLIEPVLAYTQHKGKKVVLEVQKPDNEAYYKRFGFKVVAEIKISSDGLISKTLVWSPEVR
ncbi:MAG: N-acetyltransferase [Bradymonadales bacterium]|nr:MAG: N-acetyltransferase [Bradymonadales bacterium]